MFFCTGQLVVGNKICFGRTLFVRLSIDTLDFAWESIINRTRIREAKLPSKRYDLGRKVYDVF